MSILNTILAKVFPGIVKHDAAAAATATKADPHDSSPTLQSTPQTVDIEKTFEALQAHSAQKLDWRHSIVDLMKLLGLDSDLTARKQLAKDLNYSGDTNDTASMNIWLHAEVLQKFKDNGGKIPSSMSH